MLPGRAEQGEERTPLNLGRHTGVFSEDSRRVDAAFGRLSRLMREQGRMFPRYGGTKALIAAF